MHASGIARTLAEIITKLLEGGNMKNLEIDEFVSLHKSTRSAILCGNGLSINFDGDYGNIFSRYYECHKSIFAETNYRVIGNKIFQDVLKSNYRAVLHHLKDSTEEEFYRIFTDAYRFGLSIIRNDSLVKYLYDNEKINKLVFGISQIDLVISVCESYESKGPQYVNIEHWTILVYFYFLLSEIDDSLYEFPSDNTFIKLIEVGNQSTHKIGGILDYNGKAVVNGFLIYYRFLVAYTVFNSGKSVFCTDLDRLDNLNIDGIKNFFSLFSSILTTNYDYIIENVIEREAIHIHGLFSINRTEYVFNQSLSINYKYKEYGFSDMTIGDYFLFKSFLPIASNMSKGKNKKIHEFQKNFKNLFDNEKINVLTIFGLNIENDQHLLRNYLLELFNANVQKPQIVYCYFAEEEKDSFNKAFNEVITFRDDISEYCRNVELCFVKTQDILEHYFSV